jgi:hypothetical protein
MRRGVTDYVGDFFRNLYTEMPYGRWWRTVVTNRLRAKAVRCCGHRGEPGC